MNWTITVKKMAGDFLRTCLGLSVTAIIAYYSEEVHLKPLLDHLPNTLAIAATPIVSMLLRGFANWWKNRSAV